MNLELTDDEELIAKSVDEFLVRELPIARVRELHQEDDAIDDRSWQQCADLGWLALGLSADDGGLDLRLVEEALLFRELGRHLTPGPFRSTVLAGHVAAQAGEQQLAQSIAAGARRAGLAVGAIAIDARPGDLVLVLGAADAELYEVADAEPIGGIDPGTRSSRITTGARVARVPATPILDRARVLFAAEQLGIVEAVRDMSAQYAKTRIQFGKAIGSFQAVKHRCADMAISAYSIVGEIFMAALLVDDGAPDGGFHAAVAYVLATRAAKSATVDNIQNLGGIAFTWEQDAHMYLKRALLLEHALGSQRDANRAVLAPSTHTF